MLAHKKKITAAIAAGMMTFAAASFAKYYYEDRVWNVVAVGLPDRVTPSIANLNMGSYILRQTHEPLFRNDMDGRFYSTILSSWKREKSPDRYSFCADGSKVFHSGRAFTFDDIEKVVSRLDAASLGITKIESSSSDRCVIVYAADPQLKILGALTDYWNAPSVPTQDPRIEDGLGPYRAVSIEKRQVVLERKAKLGSGFTSIKLTNAREVTAEELSSGNIDDLNSLYVEKVPSSVKETYAYYDLPLLQTRELLVNVPDDNVRSVIWNCVNIDALRHALMPGQKSFRDIASVFPTGINGARSGLVTQECASSIVKFKKEHARSVKPLRFMNWKADAADGMRRFWSEFSDKTGIPVQVFESDENKMVSTIFTVPHLFDLTIVSLAAVRSDRTPFVEFFFRSDQAAVDFVDDLRSEVEANTGSSWSNAPNENLLDVIQGRHVALPLYQEVRRFYYPRDVSGFDFSLNLIQYPEVIRLHR